MGSIIEDSSLHDALFDLVADNEGVYLHEGYSGRGMFGATCPAISGDPLDLARAVARVEDAGIREFLATAASKDALGLGEVWYYRGVSAIPHEKY